MRMTKAVSDALDVFDDYLCRTYDSYDFHCKGSDDAWSTLCAFREMREQIQDGYKRPARVVEAGERYAVLTKGGWFVRLGGIGNEGRFVGSREEAVRNAPGFGPVVRVMEDGAHEAALKEAREQGRVEARDMLKALRAIHTVVLSSERPERGIRQEVADLAADAIVKALRDEAAKAGGS